MWYKYIAIYCGGYFLLYWSFWFEGYNFVCTFMFTSCRLVAWKWHHIFWYIDTINFTFVWPCIITDSLWIRPTDALNSSSTGITNLHVSGSLSAHHQQLLAVHRLWYTLCSCDRLLPGVGWKSWRSSILLLLANGHNCIKYTKADVRLRTPDDGQKGCPKHVE
jgi:hypothetical protein